MAHTILIQDDPDLLRTLDGGLVQRRELTILLAPRGTELVDRSRQHAPDMVVVDQEPAEGPQDGLESELRSLDEPPLCVVVEDDVHQGGEGPDPTRRDLCRRRIQASICSGLGLAERQSERRAVRVPVRIGRRGDPSIPAGCRTRDVSSTGAFVVTQEPMPTEVEVRLQFRGRSLPPVSGRVVRVVKPGAAGSTLPGMAVRFAAGDELSTAQVELLADHDDGAEA